MGKILNIKETKNTFSPRAITTIMITIDGVIKNEIIIFSDIMMIIISNSRKACKLTSKTQTCNQTEIEISDKKRNNTKNKQTRVMRKRT